MGRARAKSLRRTHRQLSARDSITDNGVMSQANSIAAPCVRHFFSCEESGTITSIADIKGGVTIGTGTFVNGDIPGVSVNIDINPEISAGTLDSPGTKDFIMMSCGRCKGDSGDGDYPHNIGAPSIYFGSTLTGIVKVHPYLANFSDSAGNNSQTTVHRDMLVRAQDDDLIFATAKRGDLMEHYVEGEMTDSRDVTINSVLGALWNNFTIANSMGTFGHTAYGLPQLCQNKTGNPSEATFVGDSLCPWASGDLLEKHKHELGYQYYEVPALWYARPGSTGAVADFAQDCYGILVCIFENGLPSQSNINAAMLWMKSEWMAGNKVIYPDWAGLS